MAFEQFNNFIILASVILRNRKGEVLLIRRGENNKTYKGFWQLPEGKIEFGEQAIDTIKREVKEELGFKVISAQIFTANSCLVTYSNVDYHVLRIVFLADWKGKDPVLDTEHDIFCWYTLDKALKLSPIVDGTQEILREVSKNR